MLPLLRLHADGTRRALEGCGAQHIYKSKTNQKKPQGFPALWENPDQELQSREGSTGGEMPPPHPPTPKGTWSRAEAPGAVTVAMLPLP